MVCNRVREGSQRSKRFQEGSEDSAPFKLNECCDAIPWMTVLRKT